jgi:DNA-binding HxlR family transcriptional regulator
MSRTRFDQTPCSVAQTLEQVGDWWTLLIVRDAFFGMTRFAEFQEDLGISKAVLTDRLGRLVSHGIFDKERLHEPGARYAYRLTRKGRDLWVLLTAMRLWADKWVHGEGGEPLLAQEVGSGRVVRKLVATDEHGERIDMRRVQWALGPGSAPDLCP